MVTSRVGSLRSTCFLGTVALLASAGLVMTLPSSASATPVSRQVRVAGTDWVSAGVGGIGTAKTHGGKGTITLKGVKGKVTGAWLSWNGIGPKVNGAYTGSYNNPNIKVNGSKVIGVSQGESGSNCWGLAATSRTYLANVTRIVKPQGNGKYRLTGLGAHGDANGASLVVTFKDGKRSNNQDLYLYYGNDTDAGGYPGEDNFWNDPLTQIDYQGGPATLQLAVADGQNFGNPDDGSVTVTGGAGIATFDDIQANHWLWDGTTVPNAHHSRAGSIAGSGGGSLYDLETYALGRADRHYRGAPDQRLPLADHGRPLGEGDRAPATGAAHRLRGACHGQGGYGPGALPPEGVPEVHPDELHGVVVAEGAQGGHREAPDAGRHGRRAR